jgi:hypothetical protein
MIPPCTTLDHTANPDEAQMSEWIQGRENQEHTQRGVHADNHQGIFRMSRMPVLTVWPDDHQRVKSNGRDARQDQRDA